MNLAELQAEVITLTKRPDLVAETLQAVRSATLRIHIRDYWRRDLREAVVVYDEANYLQQMNVYELLPKFRALKYVRKASDLLFDIIEPEELFNYFGNERTDVCYLAGNVLKLRSTDPFTQMTVGYYSHPDVTEAGWDTWVGEEFPFTIIFDAAAQLFSAIGYQENAQIYRKMADDEFFYMQRTALEALGN